EWGNYNMATSRTTYWYKAWYAFDNEYKLGDTIRCEGTEYYCLVTVNEKSEIIHEGDQHFVKEHGQKFPVFTYREAQGFRKLVYDENGEQPEVVKLNPFDRVYPKAEGYIIHHHDHRQTNVLSLYEWEKKYKFHEWQQKYQSSQHNNIPPQQQRQRRSSMPIH